MRCTSENVCDAVRAPGRRAGFTLTEIVVTLGIMAVVSSVAAFNIINRMPQYRLEQAQYQILGDLRNARMEAVSRSANCQFTFNNSARTYSIWVDRNGNGQTDTGELSVKSLAKLPGIALYAWPMSGTFKPNGTFNCNSSYGYVSVSSPHGYRYVYVFPSGQIDPYGWDS
jgi:prepilin-type N-terminal cleavage/methylation domain-containing protein